MKQVIRYETIDGKLFINKDDAIKHEKLYDESIAIYNLLGADIPSELDNGNGILLIDTTSYDLAVSKTKELKKIRNLSDYDITSRECYDDPYLGRISFVFKCILHTAHDLEYVARVDQSYFVDNQHKIGKKVVYCHMGQKQKSFSM